MLKIYTWEHLQFRDLYQTMLLPTNRGKVVMALAQYFGINLKQIDWTTRKNGWAYHHQARIELPRGACPVGLAVHELAHLYNFQKNGQSGHRRPFKLALIKLAVETRYLLPKILCHAK